LKREQKGRRKIEEEGRRRSAEAGTENKLVTTPSMAKEATMGPALMEGVERTNAVVLREQGMGQGAGVPPRRDPFAMEVDRGRNYFACRGFGHMARHCRNWGRRIAENRRVEYGGGRIEEITNIGNNLKEGENLEFLN